MSRNEADPDGNPGGPGADNTEFAVLRIESGDIVLYDPENHASWVQSDTHFDLPLDAAERR